MVFSYGVGSRGRSGIETVFSLEDDVTGFIDELRIGTFQIAVMGRSALIKLKFEFSGLFSRFHALLERFDGNIRFQVAIVAIFLLKAAIDLEAAFVGYLAYGNRSAP